MREVQIDRGSEHQPVWIVLTARARAQAEAAIGQSVLDWCREDPQSDRKLNAVMHAAMEAGRLRMKTGPKPVTLAEAEDLVDEIGKVAAFRSIHEALLRGMASSAELASKATEAPPAGNP